MTTCVRATTTSDKSHYSSHSTTVELPKPSARGRPLLLRAISRRAELMAIPTLDDYGKKAAISTITAAENAIHNTISSASAMSQTTCNAKTMRKFIHIPWVGLFAL